MFRLTWSCFHQNKETGEIEPFIHPDQKSVTGPLRLNLVGIGNRTDISLPAPEGRFTDIGGFWPNRAGDDQKAKIYGVLCLGKTLRKPNRSKTGTSSGEMLSGQDRQTGASGPMAEHQLLFIRAREMISTWPPALQRLAHAVFSERGLGQIEDSQLLDACKGLLSRLHLLPPACQRYFVTEFNQNCIRLALDEKYKMYYYLMDLLNGGSFLCPTCHYLVDMLENTRSSMVC